MNTDTVKAVDTTGAGDAFVGAFSFGVASKLEIEECLKLALQKATDSVTKKGTQSSYKNQVGIFKLASKIMFVALFTDSRYSSLLRASCLF